MKTFHKPIVCKPTVIDNIRFASKKEASRYMDLKILARAGTIKNLTLQPRYKLIVLGKLICTYVPDFEYYDMLKGRAIVEDVKGIRTPTYKLKKALFEAIYSREILET